MPPSDLSPMIESTSDAENAPLLRERMHSEGYLFFDRLVDPQRALEVKQGHHGDLTSALHHRG